VLADERLGPSSLVPKAALHEGRLAAHEGPVVFGWSLRETALLAGEGRTIARDDRTVVDGVDRLALGNGSVALEGGTADGRLRFRLERPAGDGGVQVIARAELETDGAAPPGGETDRVLVLSGVAWPEREDPLASLIEAARSDLGVQSLAEADFVIDVGYGVGSRDGIEEVIDPLKAALEELGVRSVAIGATRKVTMDLGILPDSCQIGQTGVPVNPKVILAVGVSGAPQHVDYIGPRAVIFAFNKDTDAPLMVLNRTRPRPVVYPIEGDLFEQVPRFVAALRSTVA